MYPMIIEHISLSSTVDTYCTRYDGIIPAKERDPVLSMDYGDVFPYLDQLNLKYKDANQIFLAQLFMEYSPDPIGSLCRCPAMGEWRRIQIYFGELNISMREHLSTYGLKFDGWYDKPNHSVVMFQ
jgi:hypothetical protein